MRIVISMLMIAVCALAGAGEVYKWVGSDGKVHFGDRPPAEVSAEQVRIRSFSGSPEVSTNASTSAANNVVMLSTAWCGVCKRARQYFVSKGIVFTEYDVEKSEQGRAEYKRLGGRGVPIILVGNQRMNGFSETNFEHLLRAAGQ